MAASHSGIQGMVYGQSLDIEGEGKPLTLEELKQSIIIKQVRF